MCVDQERESILRRFVFFLRNKKWRTIKKEQEFYGILIFFFFLERKNGELLCHTVGEICGI